MPRRRRRAAPGSGPVRANEIAIDLPRPRPAHLGEYPSFNAYAGRIHGVLRRLGVIRH